MRRREFVALLGSIVVRPLAARAQQQTTPTIGFLGPSTPSVEGQRLAAFVQRLQKLGWIEGRTIAIEYRWGEGRPENFAEIAAEFVRLKVDVIVTSGGAVLAAKQATSLIPIVFAVANDPVGNGFVATLARPGGNVTGLSLQSPDLAGKRLEFLREIVPSLRRVAILADIGDPAAVLEMGEVLAAARTLGVEVAKVEVRNPEDIAPSLAALQGRVQALYFVTDSFVSINRIRIYTLALGTRLPTMYGGREFVEAGALVSYGANVLDLFRGTGDCVDKILRGVKPADIPVRQPTRFYLVVNLSTAKSLGLTLSPTFLARADEVIE